MSAEFFKYSKKAAKYEITSSQLIPFTSSAKEKSFQMNHELDKDLKCCNLVADLRDLSSNYWTAIKEM